jgi:MoaA/NifB/PqqE/SkfB family radical SAM enzyme
MNKDTFCALPFMHICSQRNGDYMPCGQSKMYLNKNAHTSTIEEVWNNDLYKEIRTDLINGIRHPNCEVCWKYEDKQQQSRRQRCLEWHQDVPEIIEAVAEAKQNQGRISKLPTEILLKLDNTCNLKCPTCNQYQSSLHEKEVNVMKEQNIKLTTWLQFVDDEWKDRGADKDSQLPQHIIDHMSNIKELQIEGGEPFANKKILHLLDYFINNDLLDVKLVTTTNITSLTDKIIDKFDKLNDVNLWVSYDTLDPHRFNFIRYPADYNHFMKNLNRLMDTNVNISLSYTLSIFNIEDCVDTLRDFEKYNDRLHEVFFRSVFAPNYFSIRYLEPTQKQQTKQRLIDYLTTSTSPLLERGVMRQGITDAINILDDDEGDYSSIVKERTYILETYDKLRGTDYKKLFPYIK